MSPTWFIIKSLFATFVIISFLQIRVGKESKTLETYFIGWMKALSASKRIQNVAQGGKEMTTDIIREFTTPDGGKVFIRETVGEKRDKASEKSLVVESGLVHRLLEGFKLDISDLNGKAQSSVKEQVRQELEKEIRSEYEGRLKRAGLNPKTMDVETINN